MSLPNPLPDNPLRWEGWKHYNSANFYERLGLSLDSNASTEQIEDHCRQLLVWWQKKLPLKNQPSNPLAQVLRSGLDEAPVYLVEARTVLLDPEARAKHDIDLRAQVVQGAISEFRKLIAFALVDKKLTAEAEVRLIDAGMAFGLHREEAQSAIDAELVQLGGIRAEMPVAPPPAPPPGAGPVPTEGAKDPASEFRRMLRLSKLGHESDDITDDQRDALCNMGESLGLSGAEAEDLIDEYLEEVATLPMAAGANSAPVSRPPRPTPAPASKPATNAKPAAVAPAPKPPAKTTATKAPAINVTPAARALERQKYPNFHNSIRCEMYLVPSGVCQLGSTGPEAQENEQPITPATISCFYMSRYPITNAQYERFDATHGSKRATGADDKHPVVYVSAVDAERFCEWLSKKEGRKYRLPTEAEWEYAARGLEGRIFPWGDQLNAGHYANFADARTTFPWREPAIDDGFAQSAPVGSFPRGASPFGIEDLAGNVFEWCLDGFDLYRGREVVNPRGPRSSARRIYRGGSWKSRAASLRASARAFNAANYSSNDVGFRVVCEPE